MQNFPRRSERPLFIGVGNPDRGDDAVGVAVVQHLRAAAAPHCIVREGPRDALALIDTWRGYDRVFLCDAVVSGAAAGTIFRIAAHRKPLPAEIFRVSTHGFGVAEAVELGRSLHLLPPELILYGIEVMHLSRGAALSAAAKRAAKLVAAFILAETADACPAAVQNRTLRVPSF